MESDCRIRLSKSDARRAMVSHHLRPGTIKEVFDRLRSVQFDPLQPVGSNHDLVLQARVPGYRVGDWQVAAYKKRLVYDGWDKQASLVPYAGWPVRRIFHEWHAHHFQRIFEEHTYAIEAVLEELKQRGPLIPREFEFQEKKPEWRDSWHGPNLTKQTLRALWHTGRVMTQGRRAGHHVYDLTERIVPPVYFNQAPIPEFDAVRELFLDRHKGVGILRPSASAEVWSMPISATERRRALRELVADGELIEVDIEGVEAHATPEFIQALDSRRRSAKVVFLGPLDHFIWDRTMINQVFGFDYIWEVYKPEHLRKWGYYVLPVLFGEKFVARFDATCRNGILEIKAWHWEPGEPAKSAFWPAYHEAMQRFMTYCGAHKVIAADPKLQIDSNSDPACSVSTV